MLLTRLPTVVIFKLSLIYSGFLLSVKPLGPVNQKQSPSAMFRVNCLADGVRKHTGEKPPDTPMRDSLASGQACEGVDLLS